MRDSQKARDHITSDRRSKLAGSNCILCISFILSGSQNECWLNTCDECVVTTWRLGLRAPLVARNYQIHFMLTLNIKWSWSSTVEPGKNGLPVAISKNIQPTPLKKTRGKTFKLVIRRINFEWWNQEGSWVNAKTEAFITLKLLNTGCDALISCLKINFLGMPVVLFVGEWPVNKPSKLQDKGAVNFIVNRTNTSNNTMKLVSSAL